MTHIKYEINGHQYGFACVSDDPEKVAKAFYILLLKTLKGSK